jgi:hypothetical protein
MNSKVAKKNAYSNFDDLAVIFFGTGIFLTHKPAPSAPIPDISSAQKHKPKKLNDPLWDVNLYWDSVLQQKKADLQTEKKKPRKAAVKCGIHVGVCPVNKKLNAIGDV